MCWHRHLGEILDPPWILRARDRDRDILARLRFGHQRPLNRRCPARLGHQRPVNRGCPRVSKPVSQDIQSICYCLHTGIFRLDTCDLVVAGVRISISPKYLYLYLALKVLTIRHWLFCGHLLTSPLSFNSRLNYFFLSFILSFFTSLSNSVYRKFVFQMYPVSVLNVTFLCFFQCRQNGVTHLLKLVCIELRGNFKMYHSTP